MAFSFSVLRRYITMKRKTSATLRINAWYDISEILGQASLSSEEVKDNWKGNM